MIDSVEKGHLFSLILNKVLVQMQRDWGVRQEYNGKTKIKDTVRKMRGEVTLQKKKKKKKKKTKERNNNIQHLAGTHTSIPQVAREDVVMLRRARPSTPCFDKRSANWERLLALSQAPTSRTLHLSYAGYEGMRVTT